MAGWPNGAPPNKRMKLTGAAILVSRGMKSCRRPRQLSRAFHGNNSVFSKASLPSRINTFSDIGLPLSAIDLRAQTRVPSMLKSDKLQRCGWPVTLL